MLAMDDSDRVTDVFLCEWKLNKEKIKKKRVNEMPNHTLILEPGSVWSRFLAHSSHRSPQRALSSVFLIGGHTDNTLLHTT